MDDKFQPQPKLGMKMSGRVIADLVAFVDNEVEPLTNL